MRHETDSFIGFPSPTATSFRRPGRILLLAVACAALTGFAFAAASVANPADPAKSGKSERPVKSGKADSLKALDVLITIELQSGNRILQLKDPEWMDSLNRVGTGIRRDRFDRMVGDTGVAREMRTVEEFRAYWSKLEERNGFKAMKGQYAAQDIDRTLVPKVYLFDSAVVLFPGWVVLRKKNKR